jgi:hypothetical protein
MSTEYFNQLLHNIYSSQQPMDPKKQASAETTKWK